MAEWSGIALMLLIQIVLGAMAYGKLNERVNSLENRMDRKEVDMERSIRSMQAELISRIESVHASLRELRSQMIACMRDHQ